MASETVLPSPSVSPPEYPGTSPGTIFAFVAIGFFAISGVVLQCWQRVLTERDRLVGGSGGKQGNVGEVPILWDVWGNGLGRMDGGVRLVNVKVRVQDPPSTLHEFT
jgi:hypothetical protein